MVDEWLIMVDNYGWWCHKMNGLVSSCWAFRHSIGDCPSWWSLSLGASSHDRNTIRGDFEQAVSGVGYTQIIGVEQQVDMIRRRFMVYTSESLLFHHHVMNQWFMLTNQDKCSSSNYKQVNSHTRLCRHLGRTIDFRARDVKGCPIVSWSPSEAVWNRSLSLLGSALRVSSIGI